MCLHHRGSFFEQPWIDTCEEFERELDRAQEELGETVGDTPSKTALKIADSRAHPEMRENYDER